MIRFRATALSLLIVFGILVGTAGAVSAQEDDDDGGLLEINDNSASALVQACHNQVPVNVLGIQVPVQEIARAIGLSRNTVKTYLQAALHKLGARNRVEALARAAEAGLL